MNKEIAMKLSKEMVIARARESADFEELAMRLGWRGEIDELVKIVGSIAPGVEALMDRCEAEREMRACARAGDMKGRLEARGRMVALTCAILDMGYGLPFLLGTPSRTVPSPDVSFQVPSSTELNNDDGHGVMIVASKKKQLIAGQGPKVKKVKKVKKADVSTELDGAQILDGLKCRSDLSDEKIKALRKDLVPVPHELNYCDPMKDDILGYCMLNGQKKMERYFDRDKVVVVVRPNLFGKDVVDKRKVRVMTLHKGILNHCEIFDNPSPYWAVLDVMSDLVKFRKAQVVNEVMRLYGSIRDKGRYSLAKDYGLAVERAYDVLKTHQRHRTKCHSGMSHIVDDCGGSDRGWAIIRGRKDYETLEYFMNQKSKRLESAKSGKPFISIENRAV